MSNLILIPVFVVVFGLLVFLHELGHFIMARLAKIEIEEFGFGFPPRLAKLFTWRGTEFTLNWIPFGAFVRPRGENDNELEGGMASASPWARLGVLLGGPVTNLLTGVLLFSLVFVQIGAPDTSVVKIIEIAPDSPASQVGLMVDDVIVQINDVKTDSMDALSAAIRSNLGEEITLRYQRGETVGEVRAVPRVNPPEGQGALGIVVGNPVLPISWLDSLPYALRTTGEKIRQVIALPGRLIAGQVAPSEARMVGLVGIFGIFKKVVESDLELQAQQTQQIQQAQPMTLKMVWVNTLSLMANLSVALGFFNLLPIPALDGGRIIFVLPELLFRRRIPQRYENVVHMVGFLALLALMVIITAQDIFNPIVIP